MARELETKALVDPRLLSWFGIVRQVLVDAVVFRLREVEQLQVGAGLKIVCARLERRSKIEYGATDGRSELVPF